MCLAVTLFSSSRMVGGLINLLFKVKCLHIYQEVGSASRTGRQAVEGIKDVSYVVVV